MPYYPATPAHKASHEDGGSDEISIAGLAGRIASGTYTGNNTASRAIPHGLGAIPRLVIIGNATNAAGNLAWIPQAARIFSVTAAPSLVDYAVTAPDATNFYVGNGTNYPNSANNNTQNYHWVALL